MLTRLAETVPRELGNVWILFLVSPRMHSDVLLDFSLTVKAATLILISGCGSAISSA